MSSALINWSPQVESHQARDDHCSQKRGNPFKLSGQPLSMDELPNPDGSERNWENERHDPQAVVAIPVHRLSGPRPPRLPLGLHGPSTIPKVATVSVHAEHCAPLSFRHGFRRSQIMTDERPDLPPDAKRGTADERARHGSIPA
jgi:hypothetical protein